MKKVWGKKTRAQDPFAYVPYVRDLNARGMKWEESLYERASHAMDPAPSCNHFKTHKTVVLGNDATGLLATTFLSDL